MRLLLLSLLLLPALGRGQAPAPTPRQAIGQVLANQAADWNRGDIPGFMAGYWRSDSLVFVGKSGPTYGWQRTLDSYRRRYPTPAEMGKLDFNQLRITLLGPEAAQVLGHWHLARPGVAAGDLQGWFTLVFRRVAGRWVIVSDHTSGE